MKHLMSIICIVSPVLLFAQGFQVNLQGLAAAEQHALHHCGLQRGDVKVNLEVQLLGFRQSLLGGVGNLQVRGADQVEGTVQVRWLF